MLKGKPFFILYYLRMSFFKKFFTKKKQEDLDTGLEKTKTGIFDKISKAVAGKSKVDESFLDELEYILIESDVGLDTTCLLYTSPSPRDLSTSRMPSSA